ncbi:MULTISPECIES: hypothetical protein [Pseudomonas]|jgi:hypothetical protein|uniref:Uncharacterized protein n=1 Tax=Pseudomonas synxantha TaxID=47883 RepID=A0A5D3G129_9PSED|nr:MULTISPECIES: hypothetical protein [Pseudomonas]KFF46796.1 hypothetical protein JH25_24200 [Pseudomonas sp. BRG-100]MBY8973709.1 hypothetical protein [Pseudomonas sp. P867]MCK3827282.1 hypothetical protein [Pseudomonas sp. W2Aug9]MCK3831385.1 hypothetical protein [Pseudomonas fluorescens]MCK3841726.1 hypothetical protein [Pseudomonas sp. NCIMB 10586]
MDHPLSGYKSALMVKYTEYRDLQKPFYDESKGHDDSAKLTEGLTLKVSAPAANNHIEIF